MQTLYVELGERRYPIFIGSHLDPEKLLKPYLHGRQVMLVSNTTVAPLYMQHYVEGPMGAGKTTVGRHLAELLGRDFLDSDHEIERKTGATIHFQL